MKEVTGRNITVKYFDKEDGTNTWVATSRLDDDPHDISVTVEINMDSMVITAAKISFDRSPLSYCKQAEALSEKIVGLKADRYFSMNVMKLVMGPMGCPNIMTLLNIAVNGIIYYYYPWKVENGEMTKDEFFAMLREKERNACLGHTILFGEE